jgi:F0F1-type ATP synthase membrane subunit c/vacuolar-type H+-ATPase subunit K
MLLHESGAWVKLLVTQSDFQPKSQEQVITGLGVVEVALIITIVMIITILL